MVFLSIKLFISLKSLATMGYNIHSWLYRNGNFLMSIFMIFCSYLYRRDFFVRLTKKNEMIGDLFCSEALLGQPPNLNLDKVVEWKVF